MSVEESPDIPDAVEPEMKRVKSSNEESPTPDCESVEETNLAEIISDQERTVSDSAIDPLVPEEPVESEIIEVSNESDETTLVGLEADEDPQTEVIVTQVITETVTLSVDETVEVIQKEPRTSKTIEEDIENREAQAAGKPESLMEAQIHE
jgi:hypothetical protein